MFFLPVLLVAPVNKAPKGALRSQGRPTHPLKILLVLKTKYLSSGYDTNIYLLTSSSPTKPVTRLEISRQKKVLQMKTEKKTESGLPSEASARFGGSRCKMV